jgi:hypothetical protein
MQFVSDNLQFVPGTMKYLGHQVESGTVFFKGIVAIYFAHVQIKFMKCSEAKEGGKLKDA